MNGNGNSMKRLEKDFKERIRADLREIRTSIEGGINFIDKSEKKTVCATMFVRLTPEQDKSFWQFLEIILDDIGKLQVIYDSYYQESKVLNDSFKCFRHYFFNSISNLMAQRNTIFYQMHAKEEGKQYYALFQTKLVLSLVKTVCSILSGDDEQLKKDGDELFQGYKTIRFGTHRDTNLSRDMMATIIHILCNYIPLHSYQKVV